MINLMLSQAIQIMLFCIGSILLIYSGKQDEKTRNPYLLIPALIAIGFSGGLITGLIISIASIIIFFLPAKVNKIIGKADLLLLYSLLMLIIINTNLLLSLIICFSTPITLLLLIFNKNKEKQMPLIHYYVQAYSLVLICLIIGILLGVFIYGF